MSFFDELKKKPHVANHPIGKHHTAWVNKVRANADKRAQEVDEDYDLNDMFSENEGNPDKVNTGNGELRDVIQASVDLASRYVNQLQFPITPEIRYISAKKVRCAQDSKRVLEANINLECTFRTLIGTKKSFDIPVTYTHGEIVPPSTIIVDGAMRVLAQSTVDDMVHRYSSYELEPVRDIFQPFMDRDEKTLAIENRNTLGYQPRRIDESQFLTKKRSQEGMVGGIRLEDGPYGTYLIVNEETGEDILVQTDWDFPSVASTFGWSGVDYESYMEDISEDSLRFDEWVDYGEIRDGIVDYDKSTNTWYISDPETGQREDIRDVKDFVLSVKGLDEAGLEISEAQGYLDNYSGGPVEDPGYFDLREAKKAKNLSTPPILIKKRSQEEGYDERALIMAAVDDLYGGLYSCNRSKGDSWECKLHSPDGQKIWAEVKGGTVEVSTRSWNGDPVIDEVPIDEVLVEKANSRFAKRAKNLSTPPMYKEVTEAMEEAEKNQEDTFPRAYHHLLRAYILQFVSTAEKDRWMIHLINDGYCINPNGPNRGRPGRTAKKAQENDPFVDIWEDCGWDILDKFLSEDDKGEFYDISPQDVDQISTVVFEVLGDKLQDFAPENPEDNEFFKEEVVDSFISWMKDKWDRASNKRADVYSDEGMTIMNSLKGLRRYLESEGLSEFMDDTNGIEQKLEAAQTEQDYAAAVSDLDYLMTQVRESNSPKVGQQVPSETEEPQEEMVDEFEDMSESPVTMYPGTVTPMEIGDGVKHCNGGPGRATVVEIMEDGRIIIKSQGMEYRVNFDEVEPLPSTFKKMYLEGKRGQAEVLTDDDILSTGADLDLLKEMITALHDYFTGMNSALHRMYIKLDEGRYEAELVEEVIRELDKIADDTIEAGGIEENAEIFWARSTLDQAMGFVERRRGSIEGKRVQFAEDVKRGVEVSDFEQREDGFVTFWFSDKSYAVEKEDGWGFKGPGEEFTKDMKYLPDEYDSAVERWSADPGIEEMPEWAMYAKKAQESFDRQILERVKQFHRLFEKGVFIDNEKAEKAVQFFYENYARIKNDEFMVVEEKEEAYLDLEFGIDTFIDQNIDESYREAKRGQEQWTEESIYQDILNMGPKSVYSQMPYLTDEYEGFNDTQVGEIVDQVMSDEGWNDLFMKWYEEEEGSEMVDTESMSDSDFYRSDADW